MRLAHRMSTRAIATALVALTVALGLQGISAPPAQAADADDFDPGFLISDEAFFNGSAYSASQIDTFIRDRNPGCLIAVCLTNYRENVTAKAKTSKCAAISAASNQTAGQIISKVARACGISPKAILVILQKEQSLVTNRTPSQYSFAYAMGAGCPDSTGCTTPYQGLYEQVYYGSSLLKGYTLTTSSLYTRYQAGKTSAIRYSPKSGCGTKDVYVRNQATHALYVYTPYTPNKAALDNLYGLGDECSAYGNRNFWRIYTDWWGSTGSAGALAIEASYAATGSESGYLGAEVGSLVMSEAYGGGLYQEYENGAISWTQNYGPRVIKAPLHEEWISRGGPDKYGWPALSTSSGGGLYQSFDNGMFLLKWGGSVVVLVKSVRDFYLDTGGIKGPLGWPLTDRIANGSGRWLQNYDGGTIYADGSTYVWVELAMAAKYEEFGGVDGALGWPKGTYHESSSHGGGAYQAFAGGAIYATERGGVHPVLRPMFTQYGYFGGMSTIGWPLTDEVYDEASGKRRQDFEDAAIFYDGARRALVPTALADKAEADGVLDGLLGAQKARAVFSDAWGGGVSQRFSGGTLTHRDGDEDAHRISTGLLSAWSANGGVDGWLGWPASERYVDESVGTWNQDFTGGTVFHTGSSYAAVGVHFVDLARERGVTGALGYPRTSVVTLEEQGGGEFQVFDKGTFTWQDGRGAIALAAGVWATMEKNGGIETLGWPVAPTTYDSTTRTVTAVLDHATIACSAGKACVVTLAD